MNKKIILGLLITLFLISGCNNETAHSSDYDILSKITLDKEFHIEINIPKEVSIEDFPKIWQDIIFKNSDIDAETLVIDTRYDFKKTASLSVPTNAAKLLKENTISAEEFLKTVTLGEPDFLTKEYAYPSLFDLYNPDYVEEEEELPVIEEPNETIDETLEDVCGDDICSEQENCETCDADCGCKDEMVCFNKKCYLPACFTDDDCNDSRASTKDVCENPGKAFAQCKSTTITRCKDGDGYCPEDCTESNDDDCGDSNEDSSSGSDWTTGSDTIPIGDEHVFFDFSKGKTTSDFNDGDIFANSFGDLMGECNQEQVCAELKKESTLSFNSMLNPPSSGYNGAYESLDEGDLFWVKTLEGDYGKLEITDVDKSGEFITSVSFKWGYKD